MQAVVISYDLDEQNQLDEIIDSIKTMNPNMVILGERFDDPITEAPVAVMETVVTETEKPSLWKRLTRFFT